MQEPVFMEVTPQRYAELDWLRVILIVAVFMHHVLMPFNGDNWHIIFVTDCDMVLSQCGIYICDTMPKYTYI